MVLRAHGEGARQPYRQAVTAEEEMQAFGLSIFQNRLQPRNAFGLASTHSPTEHGGRTAGARTCTSAGPPGRATKARTTAESSGTWAAASTQAPGATRLTLSWVMFSPPCRDVLARLLKKRL